MPNREDVAMASTNSFVVGQQQATPEVRELLATSGLTRGMRQVDALPVTGMWLAEGDYLCRKGDPASCMWIVMSGTIAVQADDVTIQKRERGQIVGEQAMLDDEELRGADLRAVGGSVAVLKIARTALTSHPEEATLWKNLASIISKKLHQATAQRGSLHNTERKLRRDLTRFVGEYALSANDLFPTLEGYRKGGAVIWFSDIAGFSKYSAEMTAEEAAGFVQRFLTPQVKAIERSGGYVDKFIGDAVMAFWPYAPHALAATCEAVLRAAEESRERINAIEVGGVHLGVRIGLHAGEVSAGNFGTASRAQFTIIGPSVNLAARLEQAKPAEGEPTLGSIRASARFYDSLSAPSRARLPRRGEHGAKNMGRVTIHSNND